MTYAELQARVQRRVIDLPAAVLAEVPDLVNEALRDIQERHNFKVQEAETDAIVTVEEQRILAPVPADFKEFHGRPYRLDFTGPTHELLVGPNTQQVLRRIDPADTGAPLLLLDGAPTDALGARNFEVWPMSDANSDYGDGEYRIVVPYYRYLDPLSGAGDTNWFTEKAYLYLIYKATSEAFSVDWDEERMAVWNAKAEQQYQRAVSTDKRYRLSTASTFVPHKGAREPGLEE